MIPKRPEQEILGVFVPVKGENDSWGVVANRPGEGFFRVEGFVGGLPVTLIGENGTFTAYHEGLSLKTFEKYGTKSHYTIAEARAYLRTIVSHSREKEKLKRDADAELNGEVLDDGEE